VIGLNGGAMCDSVHDTDSRCKQRQVAKKKEKMHQKK